MKNLLSALILSVATAATAHAASITITFDKPTQSAVAGQTLAFFGTIFNTTAGTIFLNGDYFNMTGNSFTMNDQFFNTVPISLSAGASSGDIELFDLTAATPLPVATYTGSYGLQGGPGGDDQNLLGSANFSITPAVAPVPEPSTLYLLLGGLSAILPVTCKARSRRA